MTEGGNSFEAASFVRIIIELREVPEGVIIKYLLHDKLLTIMLSRRHFNPRFIQLVMLLYQIDLYSSSLASDPAFLSVSHHQKKVISAFGGGARTKIQEELTGLAEHRVTDQR